MIDRCIGKPGTKKKENEWNRKKGTYLKEGGQKRKRVNDRTKRDNNVYGYGVPWGKEEGRGREKEEGRSKKRKRKSELVNESM